jgi:hypothetical protein
LTETWAGQKERKNNRTHQKRERERENMKKKGKENLSIIDTYISHEFLEIVGIVSEAVHENYGNGHINSEFSNLQNPL